MRLIFVFAFLALLVTPVLSETEEPSLWQRAKRFFGFGSDEESKSMPPVKEEPIEKPTGLEKHDSQDGKDENEEKEEPKKEVEQEGGSKKEEESGEGLKKEEESEDGSKKEVEGTPMSEEEKKEVMRDKRNCKCKHCSGECGCSKKHLPLYAKLHGGKCNKCDGKSKSHEKPCGCGKKHSSSESCSKKSESSESSEEKPCGCGRKHSKSESCEGKKHKRRHQPYYEHAYPHYAYPYYRR